VSGFAVRVRRRFAGPRARRRVGGAGEELVPAPFLPTPQPPDSAHPRPHRAGRGGGVVFVSHLLTLVQCSNRAKEHRSPAEVVVRACATTTRKFGAPLSIAQLDNRRLARNVFSV